MFRVFLILENAHLPFLFPVSTLHPNYLVTHLSLEAIYFAELSMSRMIFKGKRGEALLPLSSSSSLWATGMDESESEVTQSSWTLCNPVNCSPPGKNTGVGCHFLLQEIFLSQGLNPGLRHCRQTLIPSEPPGKWPVTLTYWLSLRFQIKSLYS